MIEINGIDDIIGGEYCGKYRYSRWVDELRGQVFFPLRRIKSCSSDRANRANKQMESQMKIQTLKALIDGTKEWRSALGMFLVAT